MTRDAARITQVQSYDGYLVRRRAGAARHGRAGASAAPPSQPLHALTSLALRQDNAAALDVNVMRTWAFCDGSRAGALQPQAGAFSEDTFRALDSVIAQARDRNIRLLLVLTNYWQDYGAHPCSPRSPCRQAARSLTREHTQAALPSTCRGPSRLASTCATRRISSRRQRAASCTATSPPRC